MLLFPDPSPLIREEFCSTTLMSKHAIMLKSVAIAMPFMINTNTYADDTDVFFGNFEIFHIGNYKGS